MNWRRRSHNSRPDLAPNHPGAEPQLDKDYQGPRQYQLVILQLNANSILYKVAMFETILASLQVDVACIHETKLLPKDKTHEITQYRAVGRGRQIQWESRAGGLIIYVRATLAFSAIHPVAVEITSGNPTTRTTQNPD